MKVISVELIRGKIAAMRATEPKYAYHFLNDAQNPSTEWDCVEDMIDSCDVFDMEPMTSCSERQPKFKPGERQRRGGTGMITPKAITEAARRYLDYLDAELQEVQFSQGRAQEDLERCIARVNECNSTIKQIHADQEEIRAWLAEQEGGEQEWTPDETS